MNIFIKLALFIPVCCLWVWTFIIEPLVMLNVDEIQIATPRWNKNLDGLRIAVVGDIHAAWSPLENLRVLRIVEKVNALKPDIILLVGDYVNGGLFQTTMNLDTLGSYLSKLSAPYGVYAIFGNHDYLYGVDDVRNMINKTGIKLLENSNQKVTTPKGDFYVAGIADPLSADYSYSQALKAVPKGASVIFLSHSPDVFREIPAGVDITFSGHTHGGQVRFPSIGAVISNTFRGDNFVSGQYNRDGKTIFITQGLGTSRLPVRFMCPPTIPVITLYNGNAQGDGASISNNNQQIKN